MQEVLNFIIIAGITINSILLILLLRAANKDYTRRILIIFFTITLFAVVHSYAQLNDFDILYLITFLPTELAEWLIAPLLYHYVLSIFRVNKKFDITFLRHLVPGLLVLIFITLPIYISIFKDTIIFEYLNFLLEHSSYYIFTRGIYFLIYLYFTWQTFINSQNKLNTYYSTSKVNEFQWIKILLIGAILIVSSDIITELYDMLFGKALVDTEYLSVSGLVVLIAYLGYHSIQQSNIFMPDFLWDVSNNNEQPAKVLSEGDHLLKQKLQELMKSEKPFLNEDLTLGQLATMLDTSDKTLSYILNQKLERNFYNYINGHRLDHFVDLLSSDKINSHTILALAQDSGFKSKTTFNRIFKKKYNCSPSEYRKVNLIHK